MCIRDSSTGLPLIPVHHIKGHVAGTYLTHKDLEPPFIALIVSGGHSHIAKVSDYTTYNVIGRTRDDAVGESFDKIARVIGLGYPGGPKVEQAAKEGTSSIHFPRVHFEDAPYDFSFSGIKTAVINYVHQKQQLSCPAVSYTHLDVYKRQLYKYSTPSRP